MLSQMRPVSNILLPICGLLIAMVSFSSGAALAKGLFPALGALGTATIRLVFAAIIMLVVLRAWRARITRHNWVALAIYGVTLCSMNLCFYMALTTLPLGVTSAIEFLGPLSVSVIFSNNRRDIIWAALAALGLLLMMPLTGARAGLDPVGIMWALASAACWALYIIYGLKAGSHHGTRTAALGMGIAAVIAVPFGVFEAGPSLLDVNLLPLVAAVAILSGALPFTLEMFSLQRLPARTFGVLLSIEPAFGALAGFVVLDEALTLIQVLAIALIVMACVGAALSARPKTPIVPHA
jgi:inner membrane transporter RhtA